VDVLVTGGSGLLGQHLVPRLREAGSGVRQMSRRGTGPGGVRGDLATGVDLRTAPARLAGVALSRRGGPRRAAAPEAEPLAVGA